MAGPSVRRKAPTDRDYARFAKSKAADLRGITKRLAAGELDLDGWADEFYSVLLEGHTEAFVLGRQRGGDLSVRGDDDETMGRDAADLQNSDFLNDFLAQLKDGDERYFDDEGNLKPKAVSDRATQYVARMRGTANEAFVASGEPDDEYDWVLGPTEHCEDCLELASLGPYTADTMISHPGDGQTDCKANCACKLRRRRDKLSGFARPDIYGYAA